MSESIIVCVGGLLHRLSTPVCIEVLLQRMRVGTLNWRLPAWWSSSPNPQCASLGARDSDAGPMLVEERAALLTQDVCEQFIKCCMCVVKSALWML